MHRRPRWSIAAAAVMPLCVLAATCTPADGTDAATPAIEDNDPLALTWIAPGAPDDALYTNDPIRLSVATEHPDALVVRFAVDGEEVGACDRSNADDGCYANHTFGWTTTIAQAGAHVVSASFTTAAGDTVRAAQQLTVASVDAALDPSRDTEGDDTEADPLDSARWIDEGTGQIASAVTVTRGYIDPSRPFHRVFSGQEWAVRGARVILRSGRIDGSVAAVARCWRLYHDSIVRYADQNYVSRPSVVAALVATGSCAEWTGWTQTFLDGSTCAAATGVTPPAVCRRRMHDSPDFGIMALVRYLAARGPRARHQHDPPRIAAVLDSGSVRRSRNNAWHIFSRDGFVTAYVAAYNAYRTAESQGVIAPTPPPGTPPGSPPPNTPLRSATDRIAIGSLGQECSVIGGTQNGDVHSQLLAHDFNYLDNLGAMWSLVHPVPSGAVPASWRDGCLGPPPGDGGWDFRTADHIRDFAQAYGMRQRMGFFVWYATTPDWVANLSPADTRAALTTQINAVMARYRGQVAVWDVANEMLAPDPPPSGGYPPCSSDAAAAAGHPRGCSVMLPDGHALALRNSSWSRKFGVSVIADAFRIARAADPGAVLEYNDYGVEGDTWKYHELLELLGYLRGAGVRVDAVGLQSHFNTSGTETHNPPGEDVARTIAALGSMGYRVNITELDVSVASLPGELDAQRSIYHDVVQACAANTACDSVTIFGVGDTDSWLQHLRAADGSHSAPWCANTDAPAPLLFDCGYQAKPAYGGVLDALLGR